MEFTKEQLKAGQAKASYQTRNFKEEASFLEKCLSNIAELAGLPHCPDQLLKGDDKARAGAKVKIWLGNMEQAGLIRFVPGPTGKLNYIVGGAV